MAVAVKISMELSEVPECAVCLQICNHPAQLPCGHIFCFLCVKGVAIQTRRCAMCRQDIPPDYLDSPVLLSTPLADPPEADTEDSYQWYYEGRSGWWRYDERSNEELETAHNEGSTNCQLLLAGALYHIDFRTMLQYRKNDASRRRRIKRDVVTAPAKGIAGIKIISITLEHNKPNEETDSEGSSVDDADDHIHSSPINDIEENDSDAREVVPSPAEFDILESIRSLFV